MAKLKIIIISGEDSTYTTEAMNFSEDAYSMQSEYAGKSGYAGESCYKQNI